MILSHDLKLIFIKTRKVAGTSFEMALSGFCGEDDIITPISEEDEATRAAMGLPGPRNHLEATRRGFGEAGHPNASIRGSFKNHTPAHEIMAQVGPRLFARYTKITVHRDPLDFLISDYFWRLRAMPEAGRPSFREWLPGGLKHLQRQYRIAPCSGPFACDRVLRYETLEQDIAATAELPDAMAEVFRSMRAKGGTRSSRSRDSRAFFESEGAGDRIDAIYRLADRERRASLRPKDWIRRLRASVPG